MSDKLYKNPMIDLAEKIDLLKKGHIKPSERMLSAAKNMAHYYNKANTGEKGHTKRLNDNSTIILAQQLEAMSAEVLMLPVEPSIAASLLSPAAGVDPGASTFAYSVMEEEGVAKPVSNYADDVPMVNLELNKVIHKLVPYAQGFFWSVDDVERAVFSNVSLPNEGMMIAMRGVNRAHDNLLAYGEPSFGISAGLANQTMGTADGQVRNTVATSGSWAGTIDNTAAVNMYGDLSRLVAEHERDSLGLYQPTQLMLTPEGLARCRQAVLTDSGRTVAEAFQAANPGIQLLAWSKLVDVDSNGSYDGRALLLCNRPDVVQKIVAKEFTLLPPEPTNLAFKVVGHAKFGGVAFKTRIGARYLSRIV
jgi:hypothetical protein